MVNLLTFPEDQAFLRTAHDIYKKFNQLPQAIVIAIRMNDIELIKSDFNSTEDRSLQKQMAFQIARQQIWLDHLVESAEDADIVDCLYNTKLPEYFKTLARPLELLEPKTPEDIYKSHLENSRVSGLTNVDSARHNLASAFVNAFVNAGFGSDKLMLIDNERGSWVWKTKDEGKFTLRSPGLYGYGF
jgi:26S proteasome regulatory subunit N1